LVEGKRRRMKKSRRVGGRNEISPPILV
jgi:hypothetical protein